MKTKMLIFSLLFFSVSIFSQTVKDTNHVTEKPMSFSTFFNPQTHLLNPDFENQLDMLYLKTDLLGDSTSIMMKTRMLMSSFYNDFSNEPRDNFLNPLHKFYLDSQKYAWIKQIVGAVQVGAVAYLAYEHLRKYTFKKKD